MRDKQTLDEIRRDIIAASCVIIVLLFVGIIAEQLIEILK